MGTPRDTSKKIRAAIKAKAERGERVGTVIPYGYKRDPEIKGHLLTNPETAPVVKMIFSLCAEGKGPRVIANALRKKKIPKPAMYRFMTEGIYGAVTDTEDMYGWNDRTVAGVLDNESYLGHTVNCRTTVVSYKDKRVIDRPESEQYRFEHTHEAIVDHITWDIVRQVRQGKHRVTSEARKHTAEFVRFISQKSSAESRKELKTKRTNSRNRSSFPPDCFCFS